MMNRTSAIGVLTLLFGGAYAALGSGLIFAGDALAEPLRKGDPAGGLAFPLWLVGAVLIVAGVLFLVHGVLGLLAGWGVLRRKSWARVLTLILSGLAILWGVLSLGAYAKSATYIVLGAAQLLYGTLAFIVMIRSGQEFSKQRTDQVARPSLAHDATELA